VSAGYVRQVINLTQTTSASYLLISSLDISRRNLALRGKELFREVMRIANYARTEINKIGGYYAYGKELINGDSVFDFDLTKLTFTPWISVWQALRFMICCAMSMISSWNLVIWVTCWHTYR
jgi:arginine/lysine/ornithine decarboxylase